MGGKNFGRWNGKILPPNSPKNSSISRVGGKNFGRWNGKILPSISPKNWHSTPKILLCYPKKIFCHTHFAMQPLKCFAILHQNFCHPTHFLATPPLNLFCHPISNFFCHHTPKFFDHPPPKYFTLLPVPKCLPPPYSKFLPSYPQIIFLSTCCCPFPGFNFSIYAWPSCI